LGALVFELQHADRAKLDHPSLCEHERHENVGDPKTMI
jgi:hypothetical protein